MRKKLWRINIHIFYILNLVGIFIKLFVALRVSVVKGGGFVGGAGPPPAARPLYR